MNIYVILKQTFDTEEKIVIQDGEISDDGVKYVINPYDEYAVEEAIRQKEQHGGSITVVSIGPIRTAEALRTALALGADEAVLITDDRIGSDEFSISKVLAAYFANNQPYDLILGGNFSIDNGGGQVAIRLSQLLQIPHVSSIIKIDVSSDHAIVLRDSEGDTETVKVTLPALFTAQQGLNEPRYPSLPGIMKAKKKPFHHLSLDDLGLTSSEIIAKTERISLFLPPSRNSGQILQGKLNQQVSQLVHLLKQSDVLSI
ncbi:electron transfer flavoprotein subunit beta/FixA family protein [Paenibacillus macquariensis]|uniref:Electron transfer flavoprotein subunit beta n=1 Tax=Paenibacillus macquariensis TaxID=948756 RepID=A0ABY1K1P8_9BACL|nr:electron transfer flavoprotein subunit beta/FixA family protein [Paenibacillus macquariensis]MEC0091723.1 electron transfer flavoprotein subunit beta/FixA family protein [Paenibacillus macquariensis]OAB32351.1 electron transfer flavoprotein subunit beta [Paenibacillus macquariensis subsp. macquariensis]SIR13284.1 electron transfer flavoprotein beta subunit [Paenibacillus macquariensis]